MKRFKILILVLLGVMAIASSCKKEYEPEMIPGNELAGEWFVTYTIGGVDVYNFGYTTILTYTTAAADGKEIWVTDNGNFWTYKAKVNSDANALTFGNTDSLNNQIGDPIKMVIKSGKVFPDGGRSKTGVVVDSISFVVGFGDDTPGTEYTVSGHMRTGFEEDEF